jgi:hypothetical protein
MPTEDERLTAAANEPFPAPSGFTPSRGFPGLPCPSCGTAGWLSVRLECVSRFRCENCGGTFCDDDVRTLVSTWSAVLAWVDRAPLLPGEEVLPWPHRSIGTAGSSG